MMSARSRTLRQIWNLEAIYQKNIKRGEQDWIQTSNINIWNKEMSGKMELEEEAEPHPHDSQEKKELFCRDWLSV